MKLFQSKKNKFEKLVCAYIPDLYRYAYWLSNDEQIAEDVVHESLITALRTTSRLKDIKVIKLWLLMIVRDENNCMRKNKKPRTIEINYLEKCNDSESLRNRNSDVDNLRYGLNKLDIKYREPLILNIMMGLSVEEIVCQMGLTTETVNNRLFYAREKLLDTFKQATNSHPENKQQANQPNFFGYVTSTFGNSY